MVQALTEDVSLVHFSSGKRTPEHRAAVRAKRGCLSRRSALFSEFYTEAKPDSDVYTGNQVLVR